MKQSTSRKWENCRLDARNVLSELLGFQERDIADKDEQFRHWQRREEWGPVGEELQAVLDPFITAVLAKNSVPARFAANIQVELSWDLWLICLEEEYKDLVEPPFYNPYLDPWYASGHFPCGWDGKQFPGRWPEKEILYLSADRIAQLWSGIVRQGRLIVF